MLEIHQDIRSPFGSSSFAFTSLDVGSRGLEIARRPQLKGLFGGGWWVGLCRVGLCAWVPGPLVVFGWVGLGGSGWLERIASR